MRELAHGVHSLGGSKGGRVRAFLVESAGELTLVDTLFPGDGGEVLAAVRSLGKSPRDVRRIVLTHAHRSHLGGVAALKRETGAQLLSHAWEADVVAGERKAQSASLRPMQPLRTYHFQLGIFLDKPPHTPCPVDGTVADGDAVGPLEVLHAPGHSPGHLAFHLAEHELLIAGDAIVTWPRFEAGWRAFTLNPVQQRASLARFASLEPRIVAVGHGDEVTEDAATKVHAFAERP